ncbi:MAG: TPM domain-containing protein [Comamonadaceae bacterium]|nr:TPM domain-containing protein [Pseudomonadota bacterium]MBS0608334.1 TPM domain-containing protein [Pseudomonadota bacterium]MDE2415665.1 TPM domain-containing protein [Comamonadaceae bacterium]
MATHPPHPPPGILRTLARLLRHRWTDGDLHRVLPPELLHRLAQHVSASEQRHSGQIRICVEGGLPLSYLWRGAGARERAITLFGKLRVWDTEHNNGVLIYLLLADHSIEVVADRGLTRHVPPAIWDAMVAHMTEALRAERYEAGLTQALSEVSALLVAHFPRVPAQAQTGTANELPDDPVVAP